MRYLPLVWASIRRRPAHFLLTALASACAACVAGSALAMAGILPPSQEIRLAVTVIAGGGFVLIMLLTGHGVAQTMRSRLWELALLHMLGFSRGLVTWLIFVEVAGACLAGVAAGLMLAQLLFFLVRRLIPLPVPGSVLLPIPAIALVVAGGLLVAVIGTAPAGWRIARLNLAAALARGAP